MQDAAVGLDACEGDGGRYRDLKAQQIDQLVDGLCEDLVCSGEEPTDVYVSPAQAPATLC